MRPIRPSRNSAIAWAVASSLALLYFATSLVVVINAFVWMATFPSIWYAIQRLIYWPLQPYLDLTLTVFGGPEVPYQTYVLLARLPFLVIPLLVWGFALRHARSRKARSAAGTSANPESSGHPSKLTADR